MRSLLGLVALVLALSWQPALATAQEGGASDASAAGDASTKADDTPKADETAKDDAEKADEAKAAPVGDGKEPAEPADKPAEPPAMTCTAKEVSGTVEWRPSKDAAWQPLKDGDQLPLGADICTGFRAKCTLVFADEAGVVEIQPLTTIRIGEFERKGDKVRTRLYLMQGSTQSAVEKSRFQSDFAIVTPEITMAVRGTQGIGVTQHWDRGPFVSLGIRGLIVVYDNRNGRVQYVVPKSFVTRGLNTPIQNLRSGSIVPVFDVHGGLTISEVVSLLSGPHGFVGPGSQHGPNARNLPGGGNPRLAQIIKHLSDTNTCGTEEIIVHEWEVE